MTKPLEYKKMIAKRLSKRMLKYAQGLQEFAACGEGESFLKKRKDSKRVSFSDNLFKKPFYLSLHNKVDLKIEAERIKSKFTDTETPINILRIFDMVKTYL